MLKVPLFTEKHAGALEVSNVKHPYSYRGVESGSKLVRIGCPRTSWEVEGCKGNIRTTSLPERLRPPPVHRHCRSHRDPSPNSGVDELKFMFEAYLFSVQLLPTTSIFLLEPFTNCFFDVLNSSIAIQLFHNVRPHE